MILRRLAEHPVLLANFDTASVARAIDGVADRVTDIEVGRLTAHSVAARARVQGSGVRPYTTNVEAFADAGWTEEVVVESWCSCPVSGQCKHGAALCLRLAEMAPGASGLREVPRPAPTWRDHLDTAIDGLRSAVETPTERPALALRFSRIEHATQLVVLRPMQQGKRGWVQRGVDWREIPGAVAARRHDPAQLQALAALQRTLSGHHWYAGADRTLDDFGPQAVTMLLEAERAGVVLYAEAPLRGVRVLAEPARATVDVLDTDGAAAITLGVELAGAAVPLSRLAQAGQPVHTVADVTDDVLTIAGLAEPLAPAAVQVWGRGPVTVPADDRDDLDPYLQRLRQLVGLGSSDGSVELPAAVPPRLRVVVSWRGASRATITWLWVYDAGAGPDDTRTCPVGSDDDLGGLRDPRAERELLDGLGDLDLTERQVEGADVVSLALLEIPDWASRPEVEVLELARPDLRPAQEAPDIALEVVEPDPGLDGRPDTTDWLDLRVVVRIQGEEVPLPDLLAAVTRGEPFLVLPSGLYLPTDSPELVGLVEAVRAAAQLRHRGRAPSDRDLLDGLLDDELGDVRVGRHDLGLLASLSDVARTDALAADWVHRARALRDLTEIPRPEATGVTAELRDYQRDGFAWLALLWQHGLGGVLADDMGLGKTLQVLALVAHTRAEGECAPFLVVAPTSVVGAWAEQAARHTPGLRVRPVTSTRKRRGVDIADLAADADVVVTTYTLLRLEAAAYAGTEWAGLVLDEAQQVKNHKSRVFEAVAPIRAPFRLAVTGTPFENRLRELWSLLSVVAPGLYPRLADFTRTVAVPIEKHDDAPALRRFQQRIRPFLLRRTKDLVAADLPPKQEQVLPVELEPRHRRLYDAHLAKERQRILGLLEDFDGNRIAILAALTTLRQLALDPALVDPEHDAVGSAKLDVLLDHLATVSAEGHRALVFSSFTGFLARARARLDAAGIEHAYLDGSTTRRAEVIDEFRTGTAPAFLISLKAGGVGLTLTEADYVYVLDPWWNPAAEAQAVDRAHRIGQTSTVMVYRLVAGDTIEDKVMALKARKAAVFAQVLDGGATTDGQVTADDIRALFD